MSRQHAPHHGGLPPTRATASVTLAWGLVNIPLSVFSGTEGATAAVARHEYTADGAPVGRRPCDKETGRALSSDEVVKKAAATDGTLVELTDDEVAAITSGPRGTAEIEAFVPLASLADGTYVVEGWSQARAAKLKTRGRSQDNPAACKAFELLRRTMAAEGVAALVKVAFRSAARYAAVLPDGRLALLAWARQVRPALAFPDVDVSDAELEMARRLLDTVGVSTPVLMDTAGEELQRYVDEKAAGGVEGPPETEEIAPVLDLTAALAASLDAAAGNTDVSVSA